MNGRDCASTLDAEARRIVGYCRLALVLVLALAGSGATRSEAAGISRTGWRGDLLRPDTSAGRGVSLSVELGRATAPMGQATPRDTTRLASAFARESPTPQPGCPVPAETSSDLWGTDGNVVAMARTATTLYIAGSFKWLGPNTGAFVPLSERTGGPVSVYAKVAGEVRAIASDGRGGWFIGGVFNAVGGKFRHNLAHILRGGQVAGWDPGANGADVNAIAVSGHTVYVGGGFTSIGGQDRRYIAALDAGSARATPWDPWSSGGITSLAVHGSTVFAGGAFDSIAGARRQNLVAIDAATGRATSWHMDAALQVDALLLQDDTLYVGGRFPWIGGHARLHLAAIDIAADTLFSFNPQVIGQRSQYLPTPTVSALALDEGVLYTGGLFTGIGSESRGGLAAIDVATALPTPWNPGSSGSWVRALAVHGRTVYVGGFFYQLGGQVRWGVGAVDRRTGEATGWNPTANGPIEAIALHVGSVFAGGYMSSVGPQVRRNGLAALDLHTGAPTAWNPNPVGRTVFSIALGQGALYAGGDFIEIGGKPRSGIGAVDTLTGAALDWHVDANGPVETMALYEEMLYVGGEFTAIGGEIRSNLAAVATGTGAVSDWNPACSGAVHALVPVGHTIYVAGYFARMGGGGPSGIERDNLAAIDLTSGRTTDWNPSADSWVNSAVVSNRVVYVGGAFTHVGGQGRSGVAAIDVTSGVPTPWSPNADAEVKAIAAIGEHVYLGGYFQHAGGQARGYLAGVDAATGATTEWDPHADASVWGLMTQGNTVYAGGAFTSVNGLPHSSLVAIADSPQQDHLATTDVGPSGGAEITLMPATPNPASARTHVRFSLHTPGFVALSVYDVEGRRVARPLDRSLLTAGKYDVALLLEGLKPGVYLYRLETENRAITRKLLLVR